MIAVAIDDLLNKGDEMRRFVMIALMLVAASSARAVPVDPYAASGIAAQTAVSNGLAFVRNVLCTDGRAWVLYSASVPSAWWSVWGEIMAVPLDEIADWSPGQEMGIPSTHPTIIATSGRVWAGPNLGWISDDPRYPPCPCSASVGTTGNSMGDVKSLFR
jgi:hypothetical protein